MRLYQYGYGWMMSLAFCAISWAEVTPQPQPTESTPKKTSVLPLEALKEFTKVYEHIRTQYVKEIDDKTLLDYAIRGMLEQLDPHSMYLDSSTYEDLQESTSGEFGGVGIEIGAESGAIRVVAPIDDSPAFKAGIKAGDLIIKMDGTFIKDMHMGQAIQRMRGPKGSKVDLTIVRKGQAQPFDVTIIRDLIKVRSVRSEWIEPGYLYVRIAQFQVDSGKDLLKELNKSAEKQTVQGLILDLRNNPGGVLQASVEVADAFINDGALVSTQGRIKENQQIFKATPGDVLKGKPMVVLINEGSASASEIVAGALQDHHRALIMGTKSFGKGSVQTVMPIAEDRALKLTTALYFTPKGRSIQAEGIKPDIESTLQKRELITQSLEMSEDQLAGHLDNANQKSVQKGASNSASNVKKTKSEKNHPEKTKMQMRLEKDSQLTDAFTLLKGLAFFNPQLAPPPEKSNINQASLKRP